MNSAVVFLVLSLVAVALSRPDDKYTDKYDNTNFQEILLNTRLLDNYVNCVLDKGPCTPEGEEIKSHLKEAMSNECLECTDKQKMDSKEVLKVLINKHKAYWNEIVSKYDPERKFAPKYEAELKA